MISNYEKIYSRKSGRQIKLEEADEDEDDNRESEQEDDEENDEKAEIVKKKRGRKAIPD